MPRQAHPWFRRSDGWWYVKVSGTPVKLVQGSRKKQAALDRWHELMLERAANPAPGSLDQTVASVIDLYLTHAKRSLAPETHQSRKRYLQWFAEVHGFRSVRDCLPIHLTQWLDANTQWASDWTRATLVKFVQRAFNWAARQRVIRSNPFSGVTHRTGEPRRPMTDAEFRAAIRATVRKLPEGHRRRRPRKRPTVGARFRRVLYFLRYTGARPCELAALKWKDVDFDHGVIVLQEHKTKRTQRTPRPRIIQIAPPVAKLLRTIQRQERYSSEHVFLNSEGLPWNRWSLGLRMRRIRERAKLPVDITLYGIRHQFGTQAVINGVDIKTLSELMGHTSTQMTEHYCHLAGHQAHLAAAMLQAVGTHRGP